MYRFRRMLLLVVLLAIFAAVVWAIKPAPARITISGKFSQTDIKEVSALVRKDLQSNILPDFSWASFKRMPGNVRLRLRYEIVSIEEASPSGAVVNVKASPKSARPSLLYVARKGTNGWYMDKHADVVVISGGPHFILLPNDSAISLGGTNSTGAK